jgi:MFS transporter, ACS family, D-galactonate transporter
MRRWGILGLLCLAFIAAYFDRINLSVALTVPEFKRFFHLTDTQRGLLSSAFFWSYCVLQIPAGAAVDRFGAKRTLALAFLLWSVTSAATGLARSFAAIFMMRLLLGVGEAVVTPASLRWIRFNLPEERRGLAIGLYQASGKIGPAVGMLAAARLTTAYGWRPMFLILGLGALVWLIPFLRLVRDDDRVIEAAQRRSGGPPAVSFATVLRSPVIWGMVIGTWAYQYSVYFNMTWLPAYLMERRGLSLDSMGLYAGFSFGGMAAVAIAAGWWADRLIARGWDAVRVRRNFVIAGLLLGSTELIGAFSDSRAVALFFAIFSLSGLGLATANYWAITQTLIPGGAVGRIVGIQNCAAQLPGIVAPILTGWLKQRTGTYESSMVVVGGLLVVGVAAYFTLMRRRYAPA